MKQKRRKPKIVTKKKSYSFKDSVFYKLSNKKRLADLLGSNIQELKSFVGNDSYRCFIQTKKGKHRQIEEPVARLDRVHTRVASLLCRIEMMEAVHSGRKGLSNLSNARAHLGNGRKVITADIKRFFPTTTRLNVFDFFFNRMKCAPDIADLLSYILTYDDHIPTGSRISMPLAYFANLRMFEEMQEVAKVRHIKMTIYVDDLTFSGATLERAFVNKLEIIAKKYGHKIHPSKTRYFREDQVKLITGAAVMDNSFLPRNEHLRLLKIDLDEWLDDSSNNKSLSNRILGRMTFISSIDTRYKDKARTFRQRLLK